MLWYTHSVTLLKSSDRKGINTDTYRPMDITKADRPHPRNYPQTPTDCRHTDNHLRLVMVVVAHCCTRQSRAPNIDSCTPEIWPWLMTLTPTLTSRQCNSDEKHEFDLDIWPTTLTFNPNLANIKVDLHTEYQGHRSNCSGMRALTDGQTDRRMLPSTVEPRLVNTLVKRTPLWDERY